jgi:hypothetical protein
MLHAVIKPCAIWGAASKGVILPSMLERYTSFLPIVIDINPAKQGKYLPTTRAQVLSSEGALSSLPEKSTMYIMNSNYYRGIMEMSKNVYHHMGVDDESI